MSDTWTIGELAERAAGTLGPSARRANGRVRDVPNERLIRWYTTIGLLDPPLTRRGRVALYGRRHLLQLIAVKRRQAEGLSIAGIQAELTGASDDMLATIARLPAEAEITPTGAAVSDAVPGTDSRAPAARPRFWAEHPASASPLPPAAPGSPAAAPRAPAPIAGPPPAATGLSAAPAVTIDGGPVHPAPGPAPATEAHPAGLVPGVRLAPGVMLLLDGRVPSPADIAALREAAGPLLAVLRERHLSDPPEGMQK